MLSDLQDGIYYDISDSVYFADQSRINCSTLKTVIKNNGATKWLEEKRKTSPEMRLGKAFHTLVLEPNLFDERFIVTQEFDSRTKEGKEIKEKLKDCLFLDDKTEDEEDKKIVLKQSNYDELQKWKNGLLFDCNGNETLANRLLQKKGLSECVLLFTYQNVPCKLKIDRLILEENHILDIKTTRSCKKDNFSNDAFDLGYYIQQMFYKLGVYELTKSYPKFTFLAVEKTENIYLSQCYNTNQWDMKAQALIDYFLPVTYEARKNKIYTTYSGCNQQEIISLSMPTWIDKKIDNLIKGE